MADFVLTLTIPELKRTDAFTWFEATHPIPQLEVREDEHVDEFTSEDWMAEKMRRMLIESIARGKQRLGTPDLERDEEIVTR